MKEKERVKASLTFKNPDRIPRDLWALPYVSLFQKDALAKILKEFPTDIENTLISPGSSNEIMKKCAKIGKYTDDWGSIWHVNEPGVVGEVKEPFLFDWSRLNKFKPPYHLIKNRNLSKINKSYNLSTKFILSDVAARLFEQLQFLRGTQNLFMDLAYRETNFLKLLKIVHEFNIENIKNWCKTEVDGIFIMDDWGTQRSLLINPNTWKEIFKPLYKEYCEIIHKADKFVFFHSDGNITEIFGDFVEIGIDAINSQLFVMDIEGFLSKFKGQITFWGEIDRQYLLPFGTPGQVCNAVMRIRKALDNGSGGLIAQCEWGKNNPEINIKAVFNAWSLEI